MTIYFFILLLLSSIYVCQNEVNVYFLKRHNEIRRNVDPPAENMPDLVYDDVLFRIASEHAETCEFKHSSNEFRMKKYVEYGGELGNVWIGENIAYSYGVDPLKYAIDGWAGEVKFYNYEKNIGEGGAVVGHYTQMVWAKTTRLGCAHKLCIKPDGNRFDFVVCNYAVGGNIIGERPYEKKRELNHHLNNEISQLNIRQSPNYHDNPNRLNSYEYQHHQQHHHHQQQQQQQQQQHQIQNNNDNNQQRNRNVSNRIKELQNKIQTQTSSNAKKPFLSKQQPKSYPKAQSNVVVPPPKKSSVILPNQQVQSLYNQNQPLNVIPPPLPPRENQNDHQHTLRRESYTYIHNNNDIGNIESNSYNIQFLNQQPNIQLNQTYHVQFTHSDTQNNVYQIHFLQNHQQINNSSNTNSYVYPNIYHQFNPYKS